MAPGQFHFRQRELASRVGDVVKFRWEMVQRDTGEIAAVGLEILMLDADERILRDYQFIE